MGGSESVRTVTSIHYLDGANVLVWHTDKVTGRDFHLMLLQLETLSAKIEALVAVRPTHIVHHHLIPMGETPTGFHTISVRQEPWGDA